MEAKLGLVVAEGGRCESFAVKVRQDALSSSEGPAGLLAELHRGVRPCFERRGECRPDAWCCRYNRLRMPCDVDSLQQVAAVVVPVRLLRQHPRACLGIGGLVGCQAGGTGPPPERR